MITRIINLSGCFVISYHCTLNQFTVRFQRMTFRWFQKHRGSNPSVKFDIFSDGILYMSPGNPPVSKISIGELAFQLFRTLFGATIDSKRDFDGRNLKNV